MGKIVSLHEHAQKKMREYNQENLKELVTKIDHPVANPILFEMLNTSVDVLQIDDVIEVEPLGAMLLDLDIYWECSFGKPLTVDFIDRRWNIDFISHGLSRRSDDPQRVWDSRAYPAFATLEVNEGRATAIPGHQRYGLETDYKKGLFDYANVYHPLELEPKYPPLFFVPSVIVACMQVHEMEIIESRLHDGVYFFTAMKDDISYSLRVNYPELLRQHNIHSERFNAALATFPKTEG